MGFCALGTRGFCAVGTKGFLTLEVVGGNSLLTSLTVSYDFVHCGV